MDEKKNVQKADLDRLTNKYEIALDAYNNKGIGVTTYYDYPDEISRFMFSLQDEPWVSYSYKPELVEPIYDKIDTATLGEVRIYLTGISRAERFSDGYWKRVFDESQLERAFHRLRELVDA